MTGEELIAGASLLAALIAGTVAFLNARWTRRESSQNRDIAGQNQKVAAGTLETAKIAAEAATNAAATALQAATTLDEWRQREEMFRNLRWAAELAIVDNDPGKAMMGLAVLQSIASSALTVDKAHVIAVASRGQYIIMLRGQVQGVLLGMIVRAAQEGDENEDGSSSVVVTAVLRNAAEIFVQVSGGMAAFGEQSPILAAQVGALKSEQVGSKVDLSPITLTEHKVSRSLSLGMTLG